MSLDTIDLLDGNVFQVTWDLGRRCNYDCSYCPITRHDNVSAHASLEELKSSANFVFEYIDLYMQHRSYKFASIGFTGGEPTVNPNFIEFTKYFKDLYTKRYSTRYQCSFALTTNGAMSQKIAAQVIENFDHVTVSYHAEADARLKKQVLTRIEQFSGSTECSTSINVMFHAEHFDECVAVCNQLDVKKIKYVPRVIGEEEDSKPSFAHKYSESQLQWMKQYWDIKTTDTSELGMKIGRPCCGSRTMCVSGAGESKNTKFVTSREFKGWSCSVNWFFMHIEQQTDSVFHHQTCQARFDQTRGPIGKLSQGSLILEELKTNLKNKTLPTIICTRKTCGCGICAPKSATADRYKNVVSRHIDTTVLDLPKSKRSIIWMNG
jgi:MoaA/NifB/PqqE/SkfB family radical SAM enzyme